MKEYDKTVLLSLISEYKSLIMMYRSTKTTSDQKHNLEVIKRAKILRDFINIYASNTISELAYADNMTLEDIENILKDGKAR